MEISFENPAQNANAAAHPPHNGADAPFPLSNPSQNSNAIPHPPSHKYTGAPSHVGKPYQDPDQNTNSVAISPVQNFADIPSFENPSQNKNAADPPPLHNKKCADTLSHIGSTGQAPKSNTKPMEMYPVQHVLDLFNTNPAQNKNTVAPYQI